MIRAWSKILHVNSAKNIEARAFVFAIGLPNAMGFKNIIVEGDHLNIINHVIERPLIFHDKLCNSLDKIEPILKNFLCILIAWIPKRCNGEMGAQ